MLGPNIPPSQIKGPLPPSPLKLTAVVMVQLMLEVKVILMNTHLGMKVVMQGVLALPPTQACAGKLSLYLLSSNLFLPNW